MKDHIPIRPDRSLLLGRQTSKWSLWDVVFHENNTIYIRFINFLNIYRVFIKEGQKVNAYYTV